MATAISKQQIKSIYALGASLGLVEHGSRDHDDNLHQLIGAITGKDSISNLTTDDASRVIADLIHRMRGIPDQPRPRRVAKKYEETPGGVTAGQQRRVWELMYELREYDIDYHEKSLGTRLCGIIKRQFHMDAAPKNPFRFLSYQQGVQLIEMLKKYVDNAAAKKLRAGDGS